MEFLKASIDGMTIRIEGYPDGVRVIRLDGEGAQLVADLVLHQSDLDFSLDCLQALEGCEITLSTEQLALWHAAIIHFQSASDLRSRDHY